MARFATVKELRQDTVRLLAEVDASRRFVITRRGKPIAFLVPFASPDESHPPVRPCAEAWEEFKSALRQSEPAYATVEEALDHSRRRTMG